MLGGGSRPAGWGWEALSSPLGQNTGEQSRSSRQRRGPGWDLAVGEGSTGEGRPGSSRRFRGHRRVTAGRGGGGRTGCHGSQHQRNTGSPGPCPGAWSPSASRPPVCHRVSSEALVQPRTHAHPSASPGALSGGSPRLPSTSLPVQPEPAPPAWDSHPFTPGDNIGECPCAWEHAIQARARGSARLSLARQRDPHSRRVEPGSPFVTSLTGACITHRERGGRAPRCPPFGTWDGVTSRPPARGARASSPPCPSALPRFRSAIHRSWEGAREQTAREQQGWGSHPQSWKDTLHPTIQSPVKTGVLPHPQARLLGAMRKENVSPHQCLVGLGYPGGGVGLRAGCLCREAQPFASSAHGPPTHEWASR